ncbi:MAG: phosphatase PAP2 family protein [Patescibacteria group bacterium]
MNTTHISTNIYRFIKNRFSRESFWGLTATWLSLTFIYALFLLLGIVEDFIHSDPIVAVDNNFNQLMILFRSDYLTKIFMEITSLGSWLIVVNVAVAFFLILWLLKKRTYIPTFWLSLMGSTLVNFLSKLAFHRPRPLYPVYTESGFSFPSGHASVAVAMYGFIIYFFLRQTKKLINKILILFLGLTLVIAIGFSRLYLGVHYLSDVWAGYLSGLLWLILGISWTEWLIVQSEKKFTNNETKINTKG